ncbi:MAG TPA: septum formation initiator family protein [Actinomycetota bacterium]
MAKASSPAEPRKSRKLVYALVATAVALSVLYPLRQYTASKQHLAELVASEKRIDAKTEELKAAKNRLSSDAEVERLAREHLHMVRPGEVAFAITGAAPTPPAADDPAAGRKTETAKPPWYKSFWRWLTGG